MRSLAKLRNPLARLARASSRALLSAALLLFAGSSCDSSDESKRESADASTDATVADVSTEDSGAEVGPTSDAGPEAGGDGNAGSDATLEAGIGCTTVAHIGDSLTAYTVGPLTSAYAAVGVTAQIDAYGGRAIKQKLPDDPKTGKQAALDFVAAGFGGCWVVALGTNDTANVAAGAWYTRAEAIDEMMTAIDPSATARVMWVNTFTTKSTGYWSNDNMKLWNQALTEATTRWPNMKVFDWASIAATGSAPFADGIHHTTAGYAVRNEAIAKAFVGFFPGH